MRGRVERGGREEGGDRISDSVTVIRHFEMRGRVERGGRDEGRGGGTELVGDTTLWDERAGREGWEGGGGGTELVGESDTTL